jgi:hypothetical protein
MDLECHNYTTVVGMFLKSYPHCASTWTPYSSVLQLARLKLLFRSAFRLLSPMRLDFIPHIFHSDHWREKAELCQFLRICIFPRIRLA